MTHLTRSTCLALLLTACSGAQDDAEVTDLPVTADAPTNDDPAEGTIESAGPQNDYELAASPPADFADGSCQGITTGGFGRDAQGWTMLPNETDGTGRIIFVSASETPRQDGMKYWVTNAKAAFDLMRRGQPDIILFKRGETFTLTQTMPSGNLSGPDVAHVQRITSYGTGARPVIHVVGQSFLNVVNTSLSNFAMTSLEIVSDRPNKEAPEGLRFNTKGKSENILFEDLMVRGFIVNFSLIPSGEMENVQIRRSQIVDAYASAAPGKTIGHSQGLYASHIDGLLLEENVFDHNGWSSRTEGQGIATIFNHDAYIQSETRCLTARGNIFARASSHGLQARGGGVIEDNLFLENPLGLSYGAVNGDAVTQKLLSREGTSGRISGNAVLDTTDITPGLKRDGGITIGNIRWLAVKDNVLAHHEIRPGESGIGFDIDTRMGIGVHNVVLDHNVLFDLAKGLQIDGNALGPVTLKNDGQNETFVNPSYTHDYFVGAVKVIDVDEAQIKAGNTKAPITELNGGDIYAGSTRLIKSSATGIFFPTGTPEKAISDTGFAITNNVLASVGKAFALPNNAAISQSQNAEVGADGLVTPAASVGSYVASIGGNTASNDGFLAAARAQRKFAWDARYTAKPATNFVRAGLKKK